MSQFRDNKVRVREALEQENWREALLSLGLAPQALANACLACLPQGEPLSSRAARIIGLEVGHLAADMRFQEQARMFVRRLMWHMNEESGNIGWGVPTAFAEILAVNHAFAEQYHKVLISYIWDTGAADNYCALPVLRQECYCGVERLLEAWPEFAPHALPALTIGATSDPDEVCRAMAARLLQRFAAQDAPGGA